ncbi:MAG TPA: cytochrome c-type biogenesis protein CcmH [Solirubrobacteraceae bacterium]|nr:cytochrome c-type biogenesis protein CcmH [Solirubrobacteraceae bacterium]
MRIFGAYHWLQVGLGPSSVSRPTDHLARLVATLMLVAALGASPVLDSVALGATPRASMPAIERQVMCVTCKIPLNVAESPQSQRERAYIRELIAEGKTEAQIKNELVGQYGSSVLALPSAKGFDLAAYLVPVAVVLALIGLLALLLPSWRRHARAQTATSAESPELSAGDAARLDADLERFD